MDQDKLKTVLTDLENEEETENQLIWLYETLLGMGIQNCFDPSEASVFEENMKTLRDDSKQHKVLIDGVLAKYR
jgi:hypothetical protein